MTKKKKKLIGFQIKNRTHKTGFFLIQKKKKMIRMKTKQFSEKKLFWFEAMLCIIVNCPTMINLYNKQNVCVNISIQPTI